MSTTIEPNPSTRKDESFPKTTTIPAGWVMEELMEVYNRNGSVADRGVDIPVPATGHSNGRSNGKTHETMETTSAAEEELFSRRLEPFPGPADMLHRMYL